MTSSPDPLERFEAEHREALRELARLEEAAARLEMAPEATDAVHTLRDVLDFVSSAVRRHNEDEERALFRLLGEGAPTEPFVEDHAELRGLERDLRAALERDERREAVRAAFALAGLLRDHIRREDEVLFPLARSLLGPDGLREVARSLEAADGGV